MSTSVPHDRGGDPSAEGSAPVNPAQPSSPQPVSRPLERGVLDQVLATLPARVSRSLDRPDTHLVVSELLSLGWTPPQLAARVAGLRIAGDTAEAARQLLLALLSEDSPRRLLDREADERARAAQAAGVPGPPTLVAPAAGVRHGPPGSVPGGVAAPVSDEARARWIAEVRRGLKGAPRPRSRPEPRTRPDCAICAQESAFFVTRDVHLCQRCVDLLGAGQVRLAPSA